MRENVMAGLDPAIHVLLSRRTTTVMPGPVPGIYVLHPATTVMPGLGPGIHVLLSRPAKDVDGRDEARP